MKDASFQTPRRTLFGRLAGVLATGLAGLLPAAAMAAEADEPDWPGMLAGKHRLVVDGYTVNHGVMLAYAHNFLETNKPGSAGAAVILRAGALPIALDSPIWAKYRIGEKFDIIDPETKAPAVKNPYLQPKPGALPNEAMALDRLHAAGVVFGACNLALHSMSRAAAGNAGVSPQEAAREWAANLVPGATLVPSGVWGLGRAQEAGCGYCSGGG